MQSERRREEGKGTERNQGKLDRLKSGTELELKRQTHSLLLHPVNSQSVRLNGHVYLYWVSTGALRTNTTY